MNSRVAWMVSVMVLSCSAVTSAAGPSVTFQSINDALPSRCYDSSITGPDSINPNQLRIGIDTSVGLVGGMYVQRGCVASTASFSVKNTMDTISFLIEAPAGYYISKVTFTQSGSTTGSRGGEAFLGATWVVNERAAVVPYSAITRQWSASVDLTGQNKTVVPVAITTSLTAGGISPQSSTAIASNPSVVVEIQPLQ